MSIQQRIMVFRAAKPAEPEGLTDEEIRFLYDSQIKELVQSTEHEISVLNPQIEKLRKAKAKAKLVAKQEELYRAETLLDKLNDEINRRRRRR